MFNFVFNTLIAYDFKKLITSTQIMFSIDDIVVSVTTLPLVRESAHSRKAYNERKENLFILKNIIHSTQ